MAENMHHHKPPKKSVVDKVIEMMLGAGGGVVSLFSGLLAAVLMLYSGYVLYDTFNTQQNAASSAWNLLKFKPEFLDDYEVPLSSEDLEAINEDYRCWLTVYDTDIDYPVVQGENDLYYASYDIYKRPSLTGAIYLAAGNSPYFTDSYNLIYGHHMDSGAMFGGLDKMTGKETGVIVTKSAIYDVQFFAVVNTDAYESRIYNVGNRKDDVLAFLRSGGAGGVGLGTQVKYFNEEIASGATKIVALSTCANANTFGRLVVFGRMVPRVFLKEVTVKKVWNDGNNQYGLRPASINVTASDGTRLRLTAAENWTATISLTKYDDDGEIKYTWTEDPVTGYRLTGNVTEGDSTTLTNTLINTPTEVPTATPTPRPATPPVTTPEPEPEPAGGTYTLTVRYVYMDGRTASATYRGTYTAGEAYNVVSPSIPGYRATMASVSGIMPNRSVVATVIYVQNDDQDGLVILEDLDTPLGIGRVNINVGECLD